jgi:regulation of enolase protein 1 (concanavalin A-like superfamily)
MMVKKGGALSAMAIACAIAGLAMVAQAQTGSLPAGWTTQDIGNPAVAGSASVSGTTWTVSGAGADIWNNSDQFRFAYQTIGGDVDISAQIASIQNVDPWTKAGLMIRDGLTDSARHVDMLMTAQNGASFQRRMTAGGISESTKQAGVPLPQWVRLVRQGDVFTGYRSADGTTWTAVGSVTLTLPASVQVGLVVSSHNVSQAATATFTNVATNGSAVAQNTLPAPWANLDIGSPAVAGSASYSGSTFALAGAGADIWNTKDEFQFVYQPLQGDAEIVARVASQQQRDVWSKAGVMIREALTGGSRHAMMVVTSANGYSFQRRYSTDGASTSTPGPAGAAPGWVKLVREGNLFSAYQSADGQAWTLVGSDTITMASTVYVGLAVTSHNTGLTSTATFTGVTAGQPNATNKPPTVTLSSPASGSTFTAPAAISLAATASDTDGTIAKVDFYNGAQLLASDTTSPYSATWSNVAAGAYSITAVATDNTGATATSAASTVTVGSAANVAPSVSITSPTSGATFTAPANITIAASATDSDGSVARVEFYQGSTLIASDTTSPYSATWSNAPAGTYSLTARAFDNNGMSTMSAAVSVTVGTSTGALPSPWTNRDIGAPGLAGSSSYASSSFTVTGAGADIYGTSDQFQFVSQQVTGDVEIIARVASLQQTDPWSKAGVMVRESLTAGSRHGNMFLSAANGSKFARRLQTDGVTTSGNAIAGAAPAWVRLVRQGNVVTGYRSTDGSTWTSAGSDTIAMASTVYVGLAVTSHNTSARATATFTDVTVRPLTGTNQPPTVAITSPTNGQTLTGPATVTIAASASDTDGTVAGVDFYVGSQLIGTDTTSPFTASWSNVQVGTYTLTAQARDNGGATRASAGVTVTVNATGGTTITLVFTASVDHDTSVTSYTVAVYRASDPVTASPVATLDIGKPTPVNGDITVDLSSLVSPLPSGSYYVVVRATGPGGTSASLPSPTFTK